MPDLHEAPEECMSDVRKWMYWPISIRINRDASTWGTHGWSNGFEVSPDRTSYFGWTLHLGPVKVLFGDQTRAQVRAWLARAMTRILIGTCRHESVSADLLEGDVRSHGGTSYGVRWCKSCGTVTPYMISQGGIIRWRATRTPTRAGGPG